MKPCSSNESALCEPPTLESPSLGSPCPESLSSGASVTGTHSPVIGTDELRRLAEFLAPGCWPTADETALLECGRRVRGLADELCALADTVDGLGRSHDGSGLAHDGLVDALGRVASGLGGMRQLAERFTVFAVSVDTYATATIDARSEMTVLAAIADRDRLAASVAGALGDDVSCVMAASAGRYALSAAGDEYTERAGDAGDAAERGAESTPPAATSGMMSMGGLAGLGALGMSAGGGLHGAVPLVGDGSSRELGVDPASLIERAVVLQTSLPAPFSEWMRVAIGVGVDSDGEPVRVVATSDPQPYQRPGFAIAPSEFLAGDGGPPEYAIIAEMTRLGVTPGIVASATTIPQGIATVLMAEGVAVASPQSARR